MPFDDNDFIKINYTAKNDEGKIIDTTNISHLFGSGNDTTDNYPMTLIVGTNQLFPKIDEEIKKLNVGDKTSIKLDAKDTFGERKEELIINTPRALLEEEYEEPYIGMKIPFEDLDGTITEINDDEVIVDFNPDYMGENLTYDIEILEKVEDISEKIEGIVISNYDSLTELDIVDVTIDDDTVYIMLDDDVFFEKDTIREITKQKADIALDIYKYIEGINHVQFVEKYDKEDMDYLKFLSELDNDENDFDDYDFDSDFLNYNDEEIHELSNTILFETIQETVNEIIEEYPDISDEILEQKLIEADNSDFIERSMKETSKKVDNGELQDLSTDSINTLIKESLKKHLKEELSKDLSN